MGGAQLDIALLPFEPPPAEAEAELRVAAYCRISTEKEWQQNSLETQISYFAKLIEDNPKWKCAGIFADTGSGKSFKKRPHFLQMMELCRKGRIDLILTKSVSRFGRNTLDTLIAVRELAALEVDVLFEVEDIQLSKIQSRLFLEALSIFAQSEIADRSQNIRWGIQRRFASGTSKMKDFICYGYTHDENGRLAIDESKANTIQYIYTSCADGMSLRKISKELYRMGIPSPTGKEIWSAATLSKILSNEKYTGCVILQKTYVKDLFNGRQIKNLDRVRYCISNNHERIVEQELFDLVQVRKMRR